MDNDDIETEIEMLERLMQLRTALTNDDAPDLDEIDEEIEKLERLVSLRKEVG